MLSRVLLPSQSLSHSRSLRKSTDGSLNRYTGILLRQRETDESLKRLKKGNRQGGALSFFGRSATTTQTPDEITSVQDSKVNLQMQLDVKAFGIEAVELGVEVESCAAFVRLRSVVEGGL